MDMTTRVHALTGPIYVEEAKPGDVLEDWGWSAILPGSGLLGYNPEPWIDALETQGPYLKIWHISDGYAHFNHAIKVPVRPFLGQMGVAPRQPGSFRTFPPRVSAGNLDIKDLTAGSRIFLPIFVEGALFSVGDGHAAQGDGEVCLTAVETPMTSTLKFKLHKDIALPEARAIVGPIANSLDEYGYYITTGFDRNLMEASKKAVRYMIEYLVRSSHLSVQDAYVLCSVTVDLKISQIVDAPNWMVSAYLPLGIFSDRKPRAPF
jgi:acetamidase/formamidase